MSKQSLPKISSFRILFFAAMLLGAFPIFGCQKNDDPRSIHIEGAITFNGEPIKNGKISFTPDSLAGNRGPMGVCKIKNGKYSTDSLGGRGVVGGKHIVEIENFSDSEANANEVADASGVNEGGVNTAGNSGRVPGNQLLPAYFEDWDIPTDQPLIQRDFKIGK